MSTPLTVTNTNFSLTYGNDGKITTTGDVPENFSVTYGANGDVTITGATVTVVAPADLVIGGSSFNSAMTTTTSGVSNPIYTNGGTLSITSSHQTALYGSSSGNEIIYGNDKQGVAHVIAHGGNDRVDFELMNYGLTNTIDAGAGDDTVNISDSREPRVDGNLSGEGNLVVSLGGGNDHLSLSSYIELNSLSVDGGAGDDFINVSDALTGKFHTVATTNITGGDGNDTIIGSGNDETLDGGTGNDSVIGGGGRDFLMGGDGNDTLVAGDGGNATLLGGLGDDSMVGGTGNDLFYGDSGKDTIDGRAGSNSVTYFYDTTGVSVNLLTNVNHGGYAEGDVLYDITNVVGGSGNDTLVGNNSGNLLNGYLGNDLIVGGKGNDYIDGGDGNDVIYGGGGNNTLIGGAGNDLFYGDTGKDNIDGGTGTNGVTYFYDTTGVSVNLLTGVNHGGFAEGDVLKNISNVVGGSGNDTLIGDDKGDLLNGYLGNDLIVGGKGNDYVDGGAGDDTIYGNGGADTLNGGDGNDKIVLSANSNASIGGSLKPDYVYGGNGDDTVVGSGANDLIRGEDGNDLLVGGYGNDTLQGGDGNDTIQGGEGANILTGGSGKDVFSYPTGDSYFSLQGTWNDTITDFKVGEDKLAFTGGARMSDLAIHNGTQGGVSGVFVDLHVSAGVPPHIFLNGVHATDLTVSDFIF